MNRRVFMISGASILGGMLVSSRAGAIWGLGSSAANRDKSHFPYQLSHDEWRKKLNPEAYKILREHGTERAGSSPLDKETRKGVYHCAGCDHALFHSDHKYDSGTGWPSFYQPIDGVESKAIGSQEDNTLWMKRVEVHCANCGGHQGHVFPDGPKPTGLRYCINGVALNFKPS